MQSVKYAIWGIYLLFSKERNAQIHLGITIIILVLGKWLKITKEEWLWILLMIGMVLTTEAINTALEKLSDVVAPDRSIQIRNLKDVSAGAVLIAAIIALIGGLIIFIPKLLNLFYPIIT